MLKNVNLKTLKIKIHVTQLTNSPLYIFHKRKYFKTPLMEILFYHQLGNYFKGIFRYLNENEIL